MANFNLNKVMLGGRLTANPELRQTTSGVMMLTFGIAVNRKFIPKNEDGTAGQSQADFINCIAWRQQAEFISRYFHKGSSIFVIGNIQTRTYNDQQGNKRYATDVVVDEVYFVDSKSENQGFGGGQGGYMPSAYDPAYATPMSQTGAAPQSQAPKPASDGGQPQFEVLSSDEELPF